MWSIHVFRRQVGRYTHPAVQPADMYKTGSNWDLGEPCTRMWPASAGMPSGVQTTERPRPPHRCSRAQHPRTLAPPEPRPCALPHAAKAGHGADVKDTISGYSAHIPGVRDRIGGPGNQYFRGDKPGGMSVPQSSWRKGRARTEFRDATRLYDKPWLKNAASPGGKTSLETAWRPDPAVSPLKGGMSVSLAMGPKTDRSTETSTLFRTHFSRVSRLHTTPHTPCAVLYVAPMLIRR